MQNHVTLYFTKMTKEHICAPFVINENALVDERANSTIKIYDYYKPNYEASKVRILMYGNLQNFKNIFETKY